MSSLLMSSRRHMTCLHLPALAQAAMTAPKAGRSADGNASSKSSNAKTHFLLSFLMKEHQNVKLVLSMFKTPPAKKRMKLENKKQTQLSNFKQDSCCICKSESQQLKLSARGFDTETSSLAPIQTLGYRHPPLWRGTCFRHPVRSAVVQTSIAPRLNTVKACSWVGWKQKCKNPEQLAKMEKMSHESNAKRLSRMCPCACLAACYHSGIVGNSVCCAM